jgi:tRNA (cytidine/uridine-2'-O-)-methyltransferase
MNAFLHIIGPTTIDLSHKAVRRAGLDYWDELKLIVHESPEEFFAWLGDREPWLVTRYGGIRYDKPEYKDDDILVFGSETRGLPQGWIDRWSERTVYVPYSAISGITTSPTL